MARLSATKTATIANGASLSGAVYLGALTLTMIQMPASWTAASLTFQGSADGDTYADIYEAAGATESTLAAGASRAIVTDPSVFVGMKYIKVRSGTSAAPVNQDAARSLLLHCVPITS